MSANRSPSVRIAVVATLAEALRSRIESVAEASRRISANARPAANAAPWTAIHSPVGGFGDGKSPSVRRRRSGMMRPPSTVRALSWTPESSSSTCRDAHGAVRDPRAFATKNCFGERQLTHHHWNELLEQRS